MSMTLEEIIEQLEGDVAALQERLNTSQPLTCPHQLCPECAKAEIERVKENQVLFDTLNEKITLINNIKATQ